MPLCKDWATIEDFATLFQYFWHRDFPIDPQRSIGAHRIDWNIHTGMVVRSIADFMGLTARFENAGRIDGILNSFEDEIAVEWEWEDITYAIKRKSGNEIDKLKVQKKNPTRRRKFAVLITYTLSPEATIKDTIYPQVRDKWAGTSWPLLLILISSKECKKYLSGRKFLDMYITSFKDNSYKEIRNVRACPWELDGTRWYITPEITRHNLDAP